MSKMTCSYPFCWQEIVKGEQYIIESTSMGYPEAWHLGCYDRFINSLQEDPTRPHEVEKIQREYWKNRDNMIKIKMD